MEYVTIPNRTVFEYDGLKNELWYSAYDLIQIRKSAGIELHAYVALFQIDVDTAKFRLYQSINSDDMKNLRKLTEYPETPCQPMAYRRAKLNVSSYSSYSLSIQEKSIPPEIAGMIRLNTDVYYV